MALISNALSSILQTLWGNVETSCKKKSKVTPVEDNPLWIFDNTEDLVIFCVHFTPIPFLKFYETEHEYLEVIFVISTFH